LLFLSLSLFQTPPPPKKKKKKKKKKKERKKKQKDKVIIKKGEFVGICQYLVVVG